MAFTQPSIRNPGVGSSGGFLNTQSQAAGFSNKFSDFFRGMTPEAKMGLLQAGLGILASPSYGNTGAQIGKGGLIGTQGYDQARRTGILSAGQQSNENYQNSMVGFKGRELAAQEAALAHQKAIQDYDTGIINEYSSQNVADAVVPKYPPADPIPPNAGAHNPQAFSAPYSQKNYDMLQGLVDYQTNRGDYAPTSAPNMVDLTYPEGLPTPKAPGHIAQAMQDVPKLQSLNLDKQIANADAIADRVKNKDTRKEYRDRAKDLRSQKETALSRQDTERTFAKDKFVIDSYAVGKDKVTDREFYFEDGQWKPFESSAAARDFRSVKDKAGATKLSVQTFNQNLDLWKAYDTESDIFVKGGLIADSVERAMNQGNSIGWRTATKQLQALIETFEKSNTAALKEVERIEGGGDLSSRIAGMATQWVGGVPGPQQQEDIRRIVKTLKALNEAKLLEVNDQFEKMAIASGTDPNFVVPPRNRPTPGRNGLNLEGKTDAEIINELLGTD